MHDAVFMRPWRSLSPTNVSRAVWPCLRSALMASSARQYQSGQGDANKSQGDRLGHFASRFSQGPRVVGPAEGTAWRSAAVDVPSDVLTTGVCQRRAYVRPDKGKTVTAVPTDKHFDHMNVGADRKLTHLQGMLE